MVEPDVWGPPLWRAIHYVALGYPENPSPADAASYRRFFGELGTVIPCSTCAVNYTRHIEELPIDAYLTGGKHRLFEWTVHLHNIVNHEKGKREISPPEAYMLLVTAQGPGLSCPVEDPLARGANLPAVLALVTIACIVGALVTFAAMRSVVRKR
jgi:hypothetical protein